MKALFSFLAFLIFAGTTATAQVFVSPRAVENNKYVYMNVVMNCHDFSQVRTSYTTLSRLFGIYRKYNIIADFYFTDMLAQRLEWSYPGFLDSLRRAGMGINIHHRSPHAITFRPTRREAENPQLGLITLFRQGRTDEAIAECEKWERRRVNVATGGLDSAVGGYDFLEQKAGVKPTCVGFGISGNFDGDSIAIGAMISLKKSGLRATVDDHEGGADTQFPFMSLRGVLSRPADSSITRWAAGTMPRDTFWWKMVLTPDADAYSPRRYAERLMSQVNKSQLTLMNAIMHETDFSYDRPPFYSVYYVSGTAGATNPVPYDTTAFPTDRIIPWSETQKNAIWAKYDSLMQYIGTHPNIRTITMQSLVQTLSDDRERSISREQCRNLASQILSGIQSTMQGASFRLPTKNFFTIPQTTDYFSLADAYYALQRSLADYARTGRLPESLSLRDIVPPLGNGAGVSANASLTLADALVAFRAQDSLLSLQIARNQYGGRMSPNVSVGGRSLNPVEYFALLARAYQAIDGGMSAGTTTLQAQQIPVPAALTPPVGDAPSQNGPSNWSVKPFRRLAAMPTAVVNENALSDGAELQASPNPAQDFVSVKFTLIKPERVVLKIFNVLGQEVVRVLDAEMGAGAHEQLLVINQWSLVQGLYFIRLETLSGISIQALQILR
ncbi:MAG: T9SS type A sorting domain-containing protein [Ignavibacteria bacterium]|nr:T9SS type A sorting domain-containing protein [Ignavibacteria bacterium]